MRATGSTTSPTRSGRRRRCSSAICRRRRRSARWRSATRRLPVIVDTLPDPARSCRRTIASMVCRSGRAAASASSDSFRSTASTRSARARRGALAGSPSARGAIDGERVQVFNVDGGAAVAEAAAARARGRRPRRLALIERGAAGASRSRACTAGSHMVSVAFVKKTRRCRGRAAPVQPIRAGRTRRSSRRWRASPSAARTGHPGRRYAEPAADLPCRPSRRPLEESAVRRDRFVTALATHAPTGGPVDRRRPSGADVVLSRPDERRAASSAASSGRSSGCW